MADTRTSGGVAGRCGRHRRCGRRGNAAVAALFWLFALALFGAPFLLPAAGPDPEGDDPGRAVSELDVPFDEDVANFEAEYGPGLAESIARASEKWFGADSALLAESGLVKTERLVSGRTVYERHCIGCHGDQGDGGGAAASHLAPRPRNFRWGIFKFTSTPTGEPPLRRDLMQTVTRGLSGSSMPDFRLVSEELRLDVVEYVHWLALQGAFERLLLDIAWEEGEVPDGDELAAIVRRRWSEDELKAVYPPIPEPARTDETVARGAEVFLAADANCAACHGPGGEGDGPSAGDFKDDWGYPIVPRDLTRGVFRAGSEPADLYRSIATGINGTPMPSYDGSIPPEDIWALVHYVQSLQER